MTEDTPTLELWGAGTTRTLRPLWVMEELGLAYQLHPIGPRTGETQRPAYTRLNPKQKVPTLVYGDFVLSESLAISRWLIESFGEGGPLYRPQTPDQRALADEWDTFIYGELDETSLYVIRRHADLASVYGEAPAAVASSAAYFQRMVAVAAERLQQRAWLVADGPALADGLLMTCLVWANHCGMALSDNLVRWQENFAQRPAWQRAWAANSQASAGAHAGARAKLPTQGTQS